MTEQKTIPNARYGSWGYFLLIVGLAGISAFLLFINQGSLNNLGISTQKIWTIWGAVFAVLLFGLIGSPVWWRWKQRRNQVVYKPQVSGEKIGPRPVEGSDASQFLSSLKNHLRTRYSVFWRRKVRLLLITGDEPAIDQLLPGLQSQQWLEGNRTVLIYGGTWGFIRWLKQGKRQQLDRSQWMLSFTAPDGKTLQWVLRSQLGKGPLALLTLRNFSLPEQIFSVDASATSQTLDRAGNLAMEGME